MNDVVLSPVCNSSHDAEKTRRGAPVRGTDEHGLRFSLVVLPKVLSDEEEVDDDDERNSHIDDSHVIDVRQTSIDIVGIDDEVQEVDKEGE